MKRYELYYCVYGDYPRSTATIFDLSEYFNAENDKDASEKGYNVLSALRKLLFADYDCTAYVRAADGSYMDTFWDIM